MKPRPIKVLSKAARRAILLKLAAHIEKHPELYCFLAYGGWIRAKQPMCPLQRVAKWLRLHDGGKSGLSKASVALGYGTDECKFYERLDHILADMQGLPRVDKRRTWLLRERGSLIGNPKKGSTTTQIAMAIRYEALTR
jgi:hypothetical protein